ncbi:MAG: hydantoinase B/oxoprolinase family protein, partial [Alphaproteobacteria bacterium]|nr:hydantoinase B/oxoprolinase family protein [Alphaproteobacteria bacterium]
GALISSHRAFGPPGLAGGQAGCPGAGWITSPDGTVRPLAANAALSLGPGDVICIRTPGGGGFGPPQEAG